jgi:hypothetical protein
MSRTYHVIDADGHVLEPFTLWYDYMDPAYRERAPKLVKDRDGKERLLLEEQILGSRAGFGGIGGIGARQGLVAADAMEYKDGRKGGFDPHARITNEEPCASLARRFRRDASPAYSKAQVQYTAIAI